MKKYLFLILFSALFGIKCSAAEDYVPLVREGIEWGYASANPGTHYGELTYYRLQFSGTTEIGGKTYHNLYKYSEFNLLPYFSQNTLVAYMREEDKKVYICYEPDQPTEYLLYDFGLKEGESYNASDLLCGNNIKIKCTGTGYVETSEGTRRYLKIDTSEPHPYFFDMLIEGIGPCSSNSYKDSGSINRPFYDKSASIPPTQIYDVLLYQRTVLEGDNKYYQGEMIYKIPVSFELIGSKDPSVWYWERPESGALESILSDNSEVDFAIDENVVTVSSASTDILYVETFDLDGRLLSTVKPVNNRCLIPLKSSDNVIIVKATTSTGSYSAKVANI